MKLSCPRIWGFCHVRAAAKRGISMGKPKVLKTLLAIAPAEGRRHDARHCTGTTADLFIDKCCRCSMSAFLYSIHTLIWTTSALRATASKIDLC